MSKDNPAAAETLDARGGGGGLFTPPLNDAPVEHYFLIDGARGLAAITILFWHYQHFLIPGGFAGHAPVALDREPLRAPLFLFYDYGLHAVELFWIISGFVFAGVYGSRSAGTRDFIVNRIARLYPLHLLTLLVVALLQLIAIQQTGHWLLFEHNDLKHFMLNLFFASSWGLQSGYSFNGPIWSVSAEILIYAFYWMVLPILYRFGIVIPVITAVVFLTIGFVGKNTIAMCGYFYFFGVSIYIFHAKFRNSRHVQIGAAAALALAAIANLGFATRPSISVVVLPGLFGALVMLLAAFDGTSAKKWSKPLSWIGNNTYGVYLWHVPVQIIILLSLPRLGISQEVVYSGWFLLFFVALMMIIARISYLWFERPVRQAIRRRFGKRRGSEAGTAGS